MFFSSTVSIIAFLATVVSIRGETWNSKQEGIKKLTLTGWLALILAISALTLSVIENNDKKKKEFFNNYVVYSSFIRPLIAMESLLLSPEGIESINQPTSIPEYLTHCKDLEKLYAHWNTRLPGQVMTTIGSFSHCEAFQKDIGNIAALVWVNDEICKTLSATGYKFLCDHRITIE